MSFYTAYLEEIEKRKDEGLNPKPIEDGMLLAEIIEQIRDSQHQHRNESARNGTHALRNCCRQSRKRHKEALAQIIPVER